MVYISTVIAGFTLHIFGITRVCRLSHLSIPSDQFRVTLSLKFASVVENLATYRYLSGGAEHHENYF